MSTIAWESSCLLLAARLPARAAVRQRGLVGCGLAGVILPR